MLKGSPSNPLLRKVVCTNAAAGGLGRMFSGVLSVKLQKAFVTLVNLVKGCMAWFFLNVLSPNSSFLRAKRFKLSECLCLNDVSPLFLFDRACWQHRYPYALVLAYVMPKRLLFHCSEPSSVQGRVQKYLAQVPNSFQEMSTVVVDTRMIVIYCDWSWCGTRWFWDVRYLLFGQ